MTDTVEDIAAPARRAFTAETEGGSLTLSYLDWGESENPNVVVCAHGLTRNAHDFDFLARTLANDFRVVCPDTAGRGESSWLPDPVNYGYATYVAHAHALAEHLGAQRLSWVGTSMGGLIGIMMAAAAPDLIRRLVLNDIGPRVARQGLLRLAGYVGDDRRFPDLAAAEAYLREVLAPFGQLAEVHWRHLASHSVRSMASGELMLAYDPAIAEPFREIPDNDVELWEVWDEVVCPVLLLRGAESDILTAATADEMTRRGPGAQLVTFPEIGHCPMLMDSGQISLVRDWLVSAHDAPANRKLKT